jgi:hypothetical protein
MNLLSLDFSRCTHYSSKGRSYDRFSRAHGIAAGNWKLTSSESVRQNESSFVGRWREDALRYRASGTWNATEISSWP